MRDGGRQQVGIQAHAKRPIALHHARKHADGIAQLHQRRRLGYAEQANGRRQQQE